MMMKSQQRPKNNLRIGLVVPHIFMHRDILPQVIFSPGKLALDLAAGLQKLGAEVTLFTPGPVDTPVRNMTADLSLFKQELAGRGDTFLDLLKKHPFTFVTLARQVQAGLIAQAYAMANSDQLDVVHIYTNEEETALPFATLCRKPVVFTHHDPFNFLVKYKNNLPKYKHLNWISMSLAQRVGMPADTNWIGNIYHGLDKTLFAPVVQPTENYVAYMGRIIQSKGVHIAIEAAKKAGVKLKIVGKHYAGKKDEYWQQTIEPQLGHGIEYVGFIKDSAAKCEFLANARALLVPSLFDEPFGMVMIEALACGTPIIGLNRGAIPEVVIDGKTGFVVEDAAQMAAAIAKIGTIKRADCRTEFYQRFTLERMCQEHLAMYRALTK